MKEADDQTLTSFLITCFLKVLSGELKPMPNEHRPKNLRQFKYREGNLAYLETTAGLLDRWQSDVRIMFGPDGNRMQIWGMHIVARVHVDGLAKAGLSRLDLRYFALNARRNGFEQTLEKMKSGTNFSLFDIPSYKEPAPVGKNGTPGSFTYNENIEDNLSFFGGDEYIYFVPQNRLSNKILLQEAYYQGGRI